ncbi:uncharacterized protein LOC132547814 [Ylistrum balloti]|uniref:uncharacterized protein LOC132547814 n=1 Tax=Ylistrum balloti TaxID=509963 RepID=UPI002905EB26|nr:uncharacterized protein LOC132547814 [Ylistrum balloti]
MDNESVTSEIPKQISPVINSEFDIELVGTDSWSFRLLHSLAITCLGLSIFSALYVIIASSMDRGLRQFFTWTKSDRFVFYMACTEIVLDITHLLDHSQILITRDHVRPEMLCKAYGFIINSLVLTQILTVNVIAVTVFHVICRHKDIDNGSSDWKMFLWIFGMPLTSSVVFAALGQFGTNGGFCLFDNVRGRIGNLIVSVPMILILIANTTLYGFTWCRVRIESRALEASLGPTVNASARSHRVARNMFLFLIVYFIQWWPASILSILVLFPNPPVHMIYFVTTFCNIGGILNAVVYFVIRRRRDLPSGQQIAKA